MPSTTGQGATDPFAQLREGETGGEQLLDKDEALIQNVRETDKKEVYEVLALQLRTAQKRGALSADAVIHDVDEGTRQEIQKRAKTLNETDKTKLTDTSRQVMGDFLQTRLIQRLLNKGYQMMNLEAYQASGLYKPGEDQIYIDYKNISPDVVFSHLLFRNPNKYAEHVCNHEDFHQKFQAKIMNAPLLRVQEGGSEITFKIQPNLVEGQASAKKNQDAELTPEYQVFKSEYQRASALIGVQRLDDAIKSGDIMSLQEALNDKKQERRAP